MSDGAEFRLYRAHVTPDALTRLGLDSPSRGVDLLVTIYSNGHADVALRPGRDEHWTTWGSPVVLTAEPMTPAGGVIE